MNTWLIFGAGSGTGAQILTLAQQQQQHVVLLIRQPDKAKHLRQQNLNVITGDACDPKAVAQVCEQAGQHATIICTLGGSGTNYYAHRLIIDTAEQYGIRRMIMVTSLSCGDNWAYITPKAKTAFGLAIREKTLAESWLQTSLMDYVILRPGGLKNNSPTGNAQLYQQQEVHGYVNRHDLAQIIIQLAGSSRLRNTAYSVIDPSLQMKEE